MNEIENRRRVSRRVGSWVLTGGGAVLACLLVATSSASAAGITYSAPWGKALVTSMAFTQLSGCAAETGRAAHFTKSTGVLVWQGTGATMTCKGKLGKSVGSSLVNQQAAAISFPVRVPAGSHAVTFNVTWNITANARYTLSFTGRCPVAVPNFTTNYSYSSCEAQSISQVINFAYLVDLTTGAIVYGTQTGGYPAYAYSF